MTKDPPIIIPAIPTASKHPPIAPQGAFAGTDPQNPTPWERGWCPGKRERETCKAVGAPLMQALAIGPPLAFWCSNAMNCAQTPVAQQTYARIQALPLTERAAVPPAARLVGLWRKNGGDIVKVYVDGSGMLYAVRA
jgi:hypothetical protein